MTWYNYSVNIVDFVSDLATKAIAEGWTREEVGYDTIYPSGYSGFKVLFESLYGSIINGSSGSSSYYFTYLTVHCRATYNSGTHVPTTNANGGDARFRMIYNADHHASATKKYYVKGWIDSKHICIDVLADPTIADNARWLIYVGEVEAVDAAANTCMCLSPEVLNQVGGGAYDDSYAPCLTETNFVHVLGDNCGYYPYIYGLGVSFASNKIRAGPLLIWRREGAVAKTYQFYYRIPLDIIRFTIIAGIEGEDDTFDDTDTFTRMGKKTATGTGYLCLCQIGDGQSSAYMAGWWWIRSA